MPRNLPTQKCANCTSNQVIFVCEQYQTLVCARCAALHRELRHTVKEISAFSERELKLVKGNKNDADVFLARYDLQTLPIEDECEQLFTREFVYLKYFEQRWVQCLQVAKAEITDEIKKYLEFRQTEQDIDLSACGKHDRKLIVPRFPELNSIISINLSYQSFQNTTYLSQIFEMQYLTHLKIYQSNIHSIGSFDVKKCKIEYLNISENHISAEMMTILLGLPCLTELNVSQCNLTTFDMENVNDSLITSLNVMFNNLDEKSFALIFGIQSLGSLYIDMSYYNLDKGGRYIRYLNINTYSDVSDIDWLPSLETIDYKTIHSLDESISRKIGYYDDGEWSEYANVTPKDIKYEENEVLFRSCRLQCKKILATLPQAKEYVCEKFKSVNDRAAKVCKCIKSVLREL